ncbi:MAG: hypothetical protein J2P28_18490 [Actinobacteria bacterium]|nr:hypothetical protein [Actinomycetota bacterium]
MKSRCPKDAALDFLYYALPVVAIARLDGFPGAARVIVDGDDPFPSRIPSRTSAPAWSMLIDVRRYRQVEVQAQAPPGREEIELEP